MLLYSLTSTGRNEISEAFHDDVEHLLRTRTRTRTVVVGVRVSESCVERSEVQVERVQRPCSSHRQTSNHARDLELLQSHMTTCCYCHLSSSPIILSDEIIPQHRIGISSKH
jgi:hypothetical protein